MVIVALQLMFSLVGIFWRAPLVYPITEVVVYAIMFYFVYMGLSLLNDNYPDTPLTTRQRRHFNWLFLINFLLITYLFAQVIAEARRVFPWILEIEAGTGTYIRTLTVLVINIFVFLLHVVFLGGMFQLRRVIYQNTMKNWYNQFDGGKK